MITRKVVVQLMLFVMIALVGVSFLGVRYVGMDRLFGAGGYRVDVQLADSGGIFPNAEVTYRGVAVGTVTGLRLRPGGVTAELYLNDDAPPIPSDTRAVVADRSAIGEQTVDLRPEHADGPFLHDGAVIDTAHTALPPVPSDVLANADTLVGSVNTTSLRTVVTELGTGFADTGPALGQLIDGIAAVTATATHHLPETVSLLHAAPAVLATQRAESQDISTYSRGLRQIAAQLKDSDPDLRAVLDRAPDTTDQVDWLIDNAGSPLADVLRDTKPIAHVLEQRRPALEQYLVAFPMVNTLGPTISAGGRGRLAFVLPFFDPPACTKGYIPLSEQRGADDLSPRKPDFNHLGCTESEGSPILVRGPQHAPTPGH
jgi:phospholipid/cholesterol/gamma-HCH transport system substrate-binding protein